MSNGSQVRLLLEKMAAWEGAVPTDIRAMFEEAKEILQTGARTKQVWTVQYTAFVTFDDHEAAQEYAGHVDGNFYLDFEDTEHFDNATAEDVEIIQKEVIDPDTYSD